ncbi:phage tail spike protein [Paenibacillus alvei]|uniref:phage tail spike protein n=3 Tax=Paenibacillus alvei TaxID=44250 RepID=UPI001F50A19B|nr:phage tail spike protein [Paenibacillus alvei]MCY9581738.1 phage tail protein [Paenibacillus alvei]MCY9586135.1 phage tail protein [Paenibacillus alvei]
MRSYLETYDKNMQRVGILVDATDIQRRRRLNSDYELSFLLPMTSDDFRQKVQLKGHVRDERGQYYVINSRQRVRDGRKLTANIVATHVMFKLADYKMPYSSYISEAYGVHVSRLTDAISAATNEKFRFSIDDTFDLYDVKDWGRGNALQALNDVIKMYRVEVDPDNFTIHLRKKIGADNGLQYRIRKNVVSTNFRDEVGSLVTRMYAQMKDGRTFIGLDTALLTDEERMLLSQIPGAITNGKLVVNYLISPYQSYWASETIPYFDGEIIEQDLEDPVKLLEATRKALREQEVPALEVAVSAADLFKLDKAEPRPGLGDTVRCIDPELGLDNVSARITELTEYPFALDKHAQVTVSNVMLRDYQDIIADLERSKRVVDNMFSGGRIRTDVFENFAKLAVQDIHASKTEILYDTRGIILVDKTDNRNQVALTSNGIVISTDGLQSARAAITARGIVAEQIVGQLGSFVSMLIGSGNDVVQINTNGIAAGHANWASAKFRVNMQGDVVANGLTANWARINSSNLNSSTWKDGYFTGNITANGEITGGTVTGALIRTAASGRRMEMDANGMRTYDGGGRNRILINTGSDSGVSAISFYGSGGGYVGEINSYSSSGTLTINGSDIMIGSNDTSSPIRMNGSARFSGPTTFNSSVQFNGDVSGLSLEIENIRGLGAQLSSLQSQIDSLRSAHNNHRHSVSVPNHNHGNPQNANSGGGTFTSSTP